MPRVRINDRWVDVPASVPEEELRRAGNVGMSRTFLHRRRGGHYLVPRGAVLEVTEGETFLDAPARVKGTDMRDLVERFGNRVTDLALRATRASWEAPQPAAPPAVASRPAPPLHDRRERVLAEVATAAPHFERHGAVRWDDGGNWLMIARYPLPERWAARWAQLLILFPISYPVTAPIGFYLDRPHRLRDGHRDPHLTGQAYFTAPDLREHGWEWYCLRVGNGPGGWRPSADWRQPDNVRSFLALVRDSLTNED